MVEPERRVLADRTHRFSVAKDYLFAALTEGRRGWLRLEPGEVEPEVLDAVPHSRIVWSTFWPVSPNDTIEFDLSGHTGWADLRFRWYTDSPPDARGIGITRQRLNRKFGADLRAVNQGIFPEPTGAQVAAGTIDRIAARVIVLDETGAVLLLNGCDPARPEAGTWWLAPGGGLDNGESFADAARRELREETGFTVADIGSPVHERELFFDFEREHFRQTEQFFVVHTERFTLDDRAWTDLERRSILGHRWWAAAELRATTETIYPENLIELLDAVS